MTDATRTYTAAEIREIELPLLDAGVPLMARASDALAAHVTRRLRARAAGPSTAGQAATDRSPRTSGGSAAGQVATDDRSPRAPGQFSAGVDDASRVVLLVGGGDNGGDALFAGATLARDGSAVEIVPTSDRMHPAGLDAALAAGARIIATLDDDPDEVAASVASADAIVDGVIGLGRGGAAAGGSPALRGRARDVVAAIVRAVATQRIRPLIIAVDLPSGIDPDSGEVTDPDAVLAADATVTFIGVKTGLAREPGSRYAGEVVLERIGVDAE